MEELGVDKSKVGEDVKKYYKAKAMLSFIVGQIRISYKKDCFSFVDVEECIKIAKHIPKINSPIPTLKNDKREEIIQRIKVIMNGKDKNYHEYYESVIILLDDLWKTPHDNFKFLYTSTERNYWISHKHEVANHMMKSLFCDSLWIQKEKM